jgi:phasin
LKREGTNPRIDPAPADLAQYASARLKGDRNMNEDQAKRFADKSAGMTRKSLEKGVAAAEETARSIEQGYSAAVESIRDFNIRLIEMAHANATAALEFAQQTSTAKGPSEAIELWSSYARRQFETLTDQSKELTALGQKIATSSAEPITRSFAEALRGVS